MTKYFSEDQILLLQAAQAEADEIHNELERIKGLGSPREYTLKFALIDAMHRVNNLYNLFNSPIKPQENEN